MRKEKHMAVICQYLRHPWILVGLVMVLFSFSYVDAQQIEQPAAQAAGTPAQTSSSNQTAVQAGQTGRSTTNSSTTADSLTAGNVIVQEGRTLTSNLVNDPEFQEMELRNRELDLRAKELDFKEKELTVRTKENYLRSLLSSEGRLLFDTEQNAIMVVDYPDNILQIEDYLNEIDVPTPQVLIEARVVEVTLEGEHSLGVNWNLFADKGGAPIGPLRLYSSNPANGIAQAISYKNTYYPPNQTTSGSEEPFNLTLFDENINLVLKALSNRLKTTILSAPSITTVNNRQAEIKVISQIRWVVPSMSVGDGGTVTLSWNEGVGSPQEVGISLNVLPRITDDGKVAMQLHPEISEKTDDLQLQAISGATTLDYTIPIVSKRTARTKVVVGDGQTLIIGGMIKNNATKGETKVPILGDMPLLGYLFKSKKETKLKTELLIFVSPKIINHTDFRNMKAAKDKIDSETVGRSVFNIESGKPVLNSVMAGDNIPAIIKQQELQEAQAAKSAVSPQKTAQSPSSRSIPSNAIPTQSNPRVTSRLQQSHTLHNDSLAAIVKGERDREREVQRLLDLFDE